MDLKNVRVGVIGLGYVGLPLAVECGKYYHTYGFDIDKKHIKALQRGIDKTGNFTRQDFLESPHLRISANISDIAKANIFIVCVPTPIDEYKVPNLSPLLEASTMIGKILKKRDIVIYEATTYPTCTQNECKNALEKASGLKLNRDFYLGYSPERINTGDKEHSLRNVIKITSGSTQKVAKFINRFYASIIPAGTHLVSSIEVAEMSKVLENAQRDLNIAFMNEAYIICDYLHIDAVEVLEAAKTKWNFLPFSPGLVGGHCISVDPYYLTHKMNAIGYNPRVISTGRLINDAMPHFIAQKIIKMLTKARINILKAKILILGIAFKPNCADIRNAKVPLIKHELAEYGIKTQIYDPLVHKDDVKKTYGIELLTNIRHLRFDMVFLATPHNVFSKLDIKALLKPKGLFYTLTHHNLMPSL